MFEGLTDAGNGGGGGAEGGPVELTFLAVGGGGGGLPTGRFNIEDGFATGLGGTFLRFARGLGTTGADSIVRGVGRKLLSLGTAGAEPIGGPGIGGARFAGGLGADGLEVSESE